MTAPARECQPDNASAAVNLQDFCGLPDDDHRAWLWSPFSFGEFTYATNGAYAVRAPRVAGIAELETSKQAEQIEKWLKPLDADTVYESVSHVELPADAEKVSKIACYQCEGSGHEHDCPNCTCKCGDCGGTGEETKIEKISIAAFGDLYRLPYLRKVLALPGIQIAALPRKVDVTPALFNFDGGVAILALMRSPYPTHLDIGARTVALPLEQR